MRNRYISIVVFVVLIAGLLFAFGSGKKAEAPISEKLQSSENTNTESAVAKDTTVVKNTPVAPVKEFTIVGKNFSFSPSMITVRKGDKVKITFENSAGFHNFVIDEYGVSTKEVKSPNTETVEFTASKAGSFEYYCSVGTHRAMGMKGTLKVE